MEGEKRKQNFKVQSQVTQWTKSSKSKKTHCSNINIMFHFCSLCQLTLVIFRFYYLEHFSFYKLLFLILSNQYLQFYNSTNFGDLGIQCYGIRPTTIVSIFFNSCLSVLPSYTLPPQSHSFNGSGFLSSISQNSSQVLLIWASCSSHMMCFYIPHMGEVMLHLSSKFTPYDTYQFHSHNNKLHNLLFSYTSVIFHSVYIHQQFFRRLILRHLVCFQIFIFQFFPFLITR